MSNFDSKSEYLRDAGEILGVSMNELEDFINPTPGKKSHCSNNSKQNRILGKLKRIDQINDTLDCDIDEIGEYCVKLLDEMQMQNQ